MNGIICIYKEKGMTSFDVVAKVRRIYKTKKVGHGGTLDPMAEGVLPVFIGDATKAVDFCPDDTKQYIAGFQFGITTDTQDITGKVLTTCDAYVSRNKMPMIERVFTGVQMQTPPMYSAVKVNGQRLYDLARKGEIVNRQPRKINIYELKVTKYEYNSGELSVTCSKGTYIRTLIHDIGQRLGTGAVMTGLLRARSGVFGLEDCHRLSELEGKSEKELEALLMPLETLYGQLPKAHLDEKQTKLFRNGATLDADRIRFDTIYDKGYYIEGSDGVFLGLGKIGAKHELEVLRRFNTDATNVMKPVATVNTYAAVKTADEEKAEEIASAAAEVSEETTVTEIAPEESTAVVEEAAGEITAETTAELVEETAEEPVPETVEEAVEIHEENTGEIVAEETDVIEIVPEESAAVVEEAAEIPEEVTGEIAGEETDVTEIVPEESAAVVEEASGEITVETTAEPVEETSEEPAEKAVEEAVEAPEEITGEIAAEETDVTEIAPEESAEVVEGVSEEITAETTAEPVEETAEEPVAEAVEEAAEIPEEVTEEIAAEEADVIEIVPEESAAVIEEASGEITVETTAELVEETAEEPVAEAVEEAAEILEEIAAKKPNAEEIIPEETVIPAEEPASAPKQEPETGDDSIIAKAVANIKAAEHEEISEDGAGEEDGNDSALSESIIETAVAHVTSDNDLENILLDGSGSKETPQETAEEREKPQPGRMDNDYLAYLESAFVEDEDEFEVENADSVENNESKNDDGVIDFTGLSGSFYKDINGDA